MNPRVFATFLTSDPAQSTPPKALLEDLTTSELKNLITAMLDSQRSRNFSIKELKKELSLLQNLSLQESRLQHTAEEILFLREKTKTKERKTLSSCLEDFSTEEIIAFLATREATKKGA